MLSLQMKQVSPTMSPARRPDLAWHSHNAGTPKEWAALHFRDKVLLLLTRRLRGLRHPWLIPSFPRKDFFGEFSEKCSGRADCRSRRNPPESAPPMKVSTPTQAVVQRLRCSCILPGKSCSRFFPAGVRSPRIGFFPDIS